jgi:hypothetical protein
MRMGRLCGKILQVSSLQFPPSVTLHSTIRILKPTVNDADYIENGKIPLMALSDIGPFILWILDHPSESSKLNLEMATAQVSFSDITAAYTAVTGKKAVHRVIPFEEYAPKYEPYPNAPANWASGLDMERSGATMSWRENFRAWWKFWGEGKGATRDMALLDGIYPERIKTVEEWMRRNEYRGARRGTVLKNIGDLMAKSANSKEGKKGTIGEGDAAMKVK